MPALAARHDVSMIPRHAPAPHCRSAREARSLLIAALLLLGAPLVLALPSRLLAKPAQAGEVATSWSAPTETSDAPPCGPVDAAAIAGCVQAPSGYRISHVEVGLRRRGETVSALSTRTDADGNFAFTEEQLELVGSTEQLEVIATYPGFDPVLIRLQDQPHQQALQLSMRVSSVQESITVEAISPTDPAQQSNQEFGFLDIVATAGANADPLFATQTLPGVVKLDDGSVLFAPRWTLVSLTRAW